MFWIVGTRCPWRDLPEDFGKWSSVFKRFRKWVKADTFYRIVIALAKDFACDYTMTDLSKPVAQLRRGPRKTAKVHRHGRGAKAG